MTLFIFSMILLLLAVLALMLLPMARTGDRKSALQIAVAITSASVLVYALCGSPRVVPLAEEHNAELRALYAQIKTTSALIEKQPQNLEAWLTLAQAFSDAGDYAAAANGFKQAVLLSKGHPRIIMAYAESLILQADGVVTDAAKKSIDIALMIDPQLPLTRYYQAVWLLQEGRQPEAMEMMKTLYHELPDDSSLKKRMKAQIGRD
ncbi:MAG: hypothetical protein SFX19_09140 [Alphaproteobacteria bacterium]|nr:hypothetical protein [Alphaproteobacteria bacterium]